MTTASQRGAPRRERGMPLFSVIVPITEKLSLITVERCEEKCADIRDS